MNNRAVFHLVSYVIGVIGISMAACAGISLAYHEPMSVQLSLLASGLIAILFSVTVGFLTRGDVNLSRRDGFGIVTFGWISVSLFGALPYLFSGVIRHPVAAVFETMSGFTTTGASVLSDLENIPRGIHFWRALTHWYGGMGVLVLCVAILPFLGVGGMQLYRAEVPGPSKDRLTPRITTTAKLLWGVYLLLTLSETLLLKVVGKMDWFDAVCHSFATVATGGFSTRSASIGAYDSICVETIIIIFMFLSGINFTLHYYALTGKPGRYFRDPECRGYFIAMAAAALLITFNIWCANYGSFGHCFRDALFTSTSVLTTTGFCTADYDRWPDFSRYLLIVLMFIGSCAGSTSGAIKMMRINILIRKAIREIQLFFRPLAVIQLKYKGQVVEQETIAHINAFFIMYVMTFVVATLLMCLYCPDIDSAASAVATTLGGVGPGLAAVGPTRNFAEIAPLGQGILILCMLLGRLEFYTVLTLCLPEFWKK